MTVEALLEREKEAVEAVLHELFPAAGEWPDRLWTAMEYAVFAASPFHPLSFLYELDCLRYLKPCLACHHGKSHVS